MADSSEASDSSEVYEVERIVDHRKLRGKRVLEYLIKWKDYPDSENTWEQESNIDAPELLEQYWSENGGKEACDAARRGEKRKRQRHLIKPSPPIPLSVAAGSSSSSSRVEKSVTPELTPPHKRSPSPTTDHINKRIHHYDSSDAEQRIPANKPRVVANEEIDQASDASDHSADEIDDMPRISTTTPNDDDDVEMMEATTDTRRERTSSRSPPPTDNFNDTKSDVASLAPPSSSAASITDLTMGVDSLSETASNAAAATAASQEPSFASQRPAQKQRQDSPFDDKENISSDNDKDEGDGKPARDEKILDDIQMDDVIWDPNYPPAHTDWSKEALCVETVVVDPDQKSALHSLIRWRNGLMSLHQNKVLREKCPHLLIDFYEKRLRFEREQRLS